MRIVHLDTGRELRGGQRQLLLLARGLARRGHSQVILARSQGELFRECRERGWAVRSIGPAALAMEARRADVVHAHDARAHTLAALTRAAPLVVSRRVAFPVGRNVLSHWKYGRAARYLAVSEFVRRELMQAGVPAGRISVVYDGVEIPPGGPPGPRETVVLAPETEDPRKGSALAREACRAAGVELRFSRQLDHDLPRAALFLYLTHSEGLGSAILLAMSCATPVVASRVGGIPEIVADGHTGLLVENSRDEVARAIQRVLEDPAGAAERAEAARAMVAARFTDAMMVACTEQAYELALRDPL